MSRRTGWLLAILMLVAVLVGVGTVALGRAGGSPSASSLAQPGATTSRSVATPSSPTGAPTLPAPSALPPPSIRPALDEPATGPVVVVPGYGGQTALLQPLVRALRRDGRQVHVLAGLGDATRDLNRQARTLGKRVDGLLAAGAPSVDVIGFSAGGVVVRIWAEDGGSAHLRRVVTLGSPHHGTEVAGLAAVLLPADCPKACRQLQPGSPLLSSLMDAAPGPNWTSIRTRNDQISAPARTAVLAGAVNVAVQDLCPGATVAHGALPRTEFVVDLVVEALDATQPLLSAPKTVESGCPARS